MLPLRRRELLRSQGWAWRDYARYGLPVGAGDAQWALVCLLKSVILGQMGKLLIDAASVTDMMMNLGTMFTFALAGGACVMVGKAVGARDYQRAREYSNTIQVMFLCIGVFMAGVVFLLRAPFVSLYSLDAETAALARRMIAICAFTLLGTTYHASCFLGINRGAGDSRFVMTVDLICGWWCCRCPIWQRSCWAGRPQRCISARASINATSGSSLSSACAAISGLRTLPVRTRWRHSRDPGCAGSAGGIGRAV